MSYYPATFPAPEGEYRIPATKGGGEPDVRRATMSRAAELAMVPYDTNAPESQILQGWLMHDNFMLRSTLGAPYEFLWANPYHPGLSYYLAPLVFHDELFGRLFIRSSWDESARWLGYLRRRATTVRERQRDGAERAAGRRANVAGHGGSIFRKERAEISDDPQTRTKKSSCWA